MTEDKNTCGTCTHWQDKGDGVHGECCADVPFWASADNGIGSRPWFVRAGETRAMVCDRYRSKESIRKAYCTPKAMP